ncbi:hypothetical protein HUU05_03670 [candidate division KSB1 bacterium]|nr:hypothetical protein [candidate division KSB1 bacterium]
MSLNCASVQEMAIHLSQQLSHAFGAAYCRIALLPRNPAPASAANFSDNGVARDLVLVALSRSNEVAVAQNVNGGTSTHAPKISEPFAPPAETVSSVVAAFHSATPKLRFSWQCDEEVGEYGCLDLVFSSPRRITRAEIHALLLMAEIARTVLAFARTATTPASSAEQVVKKLQGDVFALPFLEAKKHWIDAFEHEYLRQQMLKYFGNISKAARAARISRYTLYALLNKFQFSAQSFKRMKPQKSSLGRNAAQNGRKKADASSVRGDLLEQFTQ